MIWQDYAIMAIQFAFALALLPALVGEQKPDRWTCGLTGGLLYAFVFVVSTLGLKLAALGLLAAAGVWTVLLLQERK